MLKGAVLRYLVSDALSPRSNGSFAPYPSAGSPMNICASAGSWTRSPGDASPAQREHAIGAGMAFLEKIADCMDPGN